MTMDLHTALIWLLNSGGAAIVASFVLERIAAYDSLAAEVKKNIFIAVSVAISLIAYCVLTYVPVATLDQIAPFFMVIYAAVVAAVSGTAFHNEIDVKKDPAKG